MNSDYHITGNLINAYFICHRKVWLFAHEINPSLDNAYLEIGALIAEESYSREKKEILVGNMKIDLIKKENNNVIVGEIKKSSKGINAARMQLLFYLYQLKKDEIEVKGELLIPKERRRIPVELNEEREKEIREVIYKIKNIISEDKPPEPKKIKFCRRCAYKEFCWV